MNAKPVALALLGCIAAGCAQLDADMMVAQGSVRVEPVHGQPGVSRVSMLVHPNAPLSLSAVDPNREAGRAALLAALFPPTCQAAEEARMPLAPNAVGLERQQVTYRVTCPTQTAQAR